MIFTKLHKNKKKPQNRNIISNVQFLKIFLNDSPFCASFRLINSIDENIFVSHKPIN